MIEKPIQVSIHTIKNYEHRTFDKTKNIAANAFYLTKQSQDERLEV
jgi:hypothetical protein